MSLSSEAAAVQYPMVRYATEIGWTYLSPEDAARLRRGETGPVLWEVLIEQLQRLNPDVVDLDRAEQVAKGLVQVRPSIEGNLDAWEYLRGLKTVFVPSEDRERNVSLLNVDDPERNTFHVTPEFSFTNGTKTIRPDVVFLVNGIPVILVEAKAATRQRGMSEAFDQVVRYHRDGPELLAITQLHTLSQLVHFFYGATWSLSAKTLLNWRDETAGADYEALCKTFVHPERVLRMLTDFILFTRRDDELSKVVLRPHQMRAMDKVVERAASGQRRGLVWHTQGSGKTYTMITAAEKLIRTPAFENPTVLMLVDRNELEAQLFGNLEAVGFGHVEVADSKKHLREFLETDYRGVLVSTIHKFDDMPPDVMTRDNVFVLIDEAHRTTTGDLGNFLMGALPNATYIGLFVLLGIVSAIIYEPVTTIPELLLLNEPPDFLFAEAMPLSIGFALGSAAVIAALFGSRWWHYLPALVTMVPLTLFLGLNISVLGMVELPRSEFYLVATTFGLVVAIVLVYAVVFGALEWRKLRSAAAR